MRLLLLLGGERSLSRKADGAPAGAVRAYQRVSGPEAVGTTRRQSILGGACAEDIGEMSKKLKAAVYDRDWNRATSR
jgi:hypothetical protein